MHHGWRSIVAAACLWIAALTLYCAPQLSLSSLLSALSLPGAARNAVNTSAATVVVFPQRPTASLGSQSQRLLDLRDRARSMFDFGFDSYILHAFPRDNLRPLSCSGADW